MLSDLCVSKIYPFVSIYKYSSVYPNGNFLGHILLDFSQISAFFVSETALVEITSWPVLIARI